MMKQPAAQPCNHQYKRINEGDNEEIKVKWGASKNKPAWENIRRTE
jgi:hypothetical protein